MHTDPIADLLTRIRNAHMRGRITVVMPYSKMKEEIAKILKTNNFIEDFAETKDSKFKELVVTLKEDKVDFALKRVSKPGQRIYVKAAEIKKVKNGLGIGIISTSQGVMTTKEAKQKGLGGELMCEIS